MFGLLSLIAARRLPFRLVDSFLFGSGGILNLG